MIVLTGRELHQPVYRAAYAADTSALTLLALVEAESRRNSAAERWYSYDVSYIQSLIAAGQWHILQDIVNNITYVHDSDDISFGCTQQTPRWSVEYKERFGLDTSHRNDLAFILEMRDRYLDPSYALVRAASLVKSLLARPDVRGSELMALFKYNRAAVGVMPPPANQDNYSRALKQARILFADDVQEVKANMADEEHSFNFGIADKAKELTDAGIDVGKPLEDEQKLTEHVTIQTTGKGVMWYSDAGVTLFLAGL